MEILLNPIKELLSVPRKLVFTVHQNPDGDTLGAALGLAHFFQQLSHEVLVISPNFFPDNLKFLPDSDKVLIFSESKEKAIEALNKAEIIFCMDYNEAKRVGELTPYLKSARATKIMIDHHPQPEKFVDFTFSETKVSSTCELTFEFANLFDTKGITKTVAECLFTGILTDTGVFSHNCSRPRLYEIVAFLLNTGINKNEIHNQLFNTSTEGRLRLVGYCLSEKMVLLPEYNTAYITLTHEEKKRFNYQIGDSEGIVNMPLSIKGICFSVFFMEHEDLTKLSFRSIGTFETNHMARSYFNGGGHINASGGQTKLPIHEAVQQFLELLPNYKTELNQ